MAEVLAMPKRVTCVKYCAELVADDEGGNPKDHIESNMQMRTTDDWVIFRVATQVQDGSFKMELEHHVYFHHADLPESVSEAERGEFIARSVLPGVHPYMQEALASATARLRPGKILNLSIDFNDPVITHQ